MTVKYQWQKSVLTFLSHGVPMCCKDCLNHHTSSQRGNIPCAARCMTEDNCDAFYYESSVCHHSRSGGLRGAEQASSSSRAVFMDASKPIGNSWSQIMPDLIVLILSQWIAFGLPGVRGGHAIPELAFRTGVGRKTRKPWMVALNAQEMRLSNKIALVEIYRVGQNLGYNFAWPSCAKFRRSGKVLGCRRNAACQLPTKWKTAYIL